MRDGYKRKWRHFIQFTPCAFFTPICDLINYSKLRLLVYAGFACRSMKKWIWNLSRAGFWVPPSFIPDVEGRFWPGGAVPCEIATDEWLPELTTKTKKQKCFRENGQIRTPPHRRLMRNLFLCWFRLNFFSCNSGYV